MEIKLGQKVRDNVTGFEGIAVARIEYINGCIQYCVKPKVEADGKMTQGEYLDIGSLDIVDNGICRKPKPTGGPQIDCPRH